MYELLISLGAGFYGGILVGTYYDCAPYINKVNKTFANFSLMITENFKMLTQEELVEEKEESLETIEEESEDENEDEKPKTE